MNVVYNPKKKQIDWNLHVLLNQYNIEYSLRDLDQFVPLGSPDRMFQFVAEKNQFKIECDGDPVFSFQIPDPVSFLNPGQFRGRFQYYSLSNHFFWKWKTLKVRFRVYYFISRQALIVHLGIRQTDPHGFQFVLDPKTQYQFSKKNRQIKIENGLLRGSSDMRDIQVAFYISKDATKKRLILQNEQSYWNQHCKKSSLLYNHHFIFSKNPVFMKDFLSGLYYQSKMNHKRDDIEKFIFIDPEQEKVIFRKNRNKAFRNFYFRETLHESYYFEGFYRNNYLEFLLLKSKGRKTIQLINEKRGWIDQVSIYDKKLNQKRLAQKEGESIIVALEKNRAYFISI